MPFFKVRIKFIFHQNKEAQHGKAITQQIQNKIHPAKYFIYDIGYIHSTKYFTHTHSLCRYDKHRKKA